MKRTSVFLVPRMVRELTTIGKPTGLKPAQLIRVAIAEFVSRNPQVSKGNTHE
jgi:hypothetical protein